MKLSKINYQHVINNYCKFVAIETSHCRVSSCIISTYLGKAILLHAATKTEKTPEILVLLALLASKLNEFRWKISVTQYWNKVEGHKHAYQ